MADRTWKDDVRDQQAHKRFLDNKKKIEAKEKLRWMYDQKNGDAEEFLKGKKIDAKFLADNEDLIKSQKLKIFNTTDVNQDNEAFVKFHEDPLTQIKREELKQRQAVLTNPLRLAQIQKEIDDLKKGKKSKKSKKKSKKRSKKRHRRGSSSESDKSSSSSDSYERKKRRKEKKQAEKRRRKDDRRERKRQKRKEEEELRKQKEMETLGPDPELYADRDTIQEEQSKLRQGEAPSDRKRETKKLTKEEKELKALEMQQRAENLEKEREERYNNVLAVKDEKEGEIPSGKSQAEFINDVSRKAFVDTSMDLSERITRNRHYNQRPAHDL